MMSAETPHKAALSRELCAASVRALAAAPEARFRADVLQTRQQRLAAPAFHPALSASLPVDRRALVDALSLKLKHHNSQVHAEYRPDAHLARRVYDLLEQLRLESLASLSGSRVNLDASFCRWCLQVQQSSLLENTLVYCCSRW